MTRALAPEQAKKLPEPIFTPATKAAEGHDENISFARVEQLIGKPLAEKVREISIRLYREAAEYAAEKGIIIADTKFEFGISELPYHEGVKGAPQNTIIGGASLWVFSGKPKSHYKGIAKFFTFLSSPEIQAEWHQGTGYVPITVAAYELTKKEGYYEKNPGTDIAVEQLLLKHPTKASKGLRLGNMVQIRNIIDEELESVWTGKKSAKAALDEAVKRGNEELRKFARANRG